VITTQVRRADELQHDLFGNAGCREQRSQGVGSPRLTGDLREDDCLLVEFVLESLMRLVERKLPWRLRDRGDGKQAFDCAVQACALADLAK
jgi:hypothetical protein